MTLQGVEVACNTSCVHAVIAGTCLWMLQRTKLMSPADSLQLLGTVEPRICSVHTCMQCAASGHDSLA